MSMANATSFGNSGTAGNNTTIGNRGWFTYPKRNLFAKVRLFCFPYAGGGSLIFRAWPKLLPSHVEVCTAQLPGRGARMKEAPYTSLHMIVDELRKELLPLLDRPFAFFGHSMGGIIAFELARLLHREHGVEPEHLFISGRRAPQHADFDRLTYNLPDEEFVEEVRRLNGTPKEVLEHPELMEMMMPVLRADFTVCQTYEYEAGSLLNCPITALGGLGDNEVSSDQLEGWRYQTKGPFVMRLFAGDHFFIQSAQPLVLHALSQSFQRMM